MYYIIHFAIFYYRIMSSYRSFMHMNILAEFSTFWDWQISLILPASKNLYKNLLKFSKILWDSKNKTDCSRFIHRHLLLAEDKPTYLHYVTLLFLSFATSWLNILVCVICTDILFIHYHPVWRILFVKTLIMNSKKCKFLS